MHETQLRKQIIEIGRLCYQRNLLVAMDGNLSVRLPSGHILCTKSGCHKGFLTDNDLVVIDMNGKHLRGSGKPTSEMAMHLSCYRSRPDIKAIVHAHPPLAVAFTIANVSLAKCVLPEVVLTLGVVPTLSYETTGTQNLADKVGEAIRDHNAVLMDRHGAVCVGGDLLTAFCNLETLEHTALITKTAIELGGVKELPPQEAIALRSMGLKRYGGPPSAVAKADEPCADLSQLCTECSTSDSSVTAPETNIRLTGDHVSPREASRMESSQPYTSMEDQLVEATLRAISQK
ncbi:MAG: aldolase [Deltaproteobacteria bacterium]|nr:aldolase [Deltaproteobacteria bacterium]